MRALTTSDLLAIWERGADQLPVDRALVVLGFAFPQVPAAELANLTIGQRDACLIRLRALTFGPQFTGLAVCPACGERLELAFQVADFHVEQVELPEPDARRAEVMEAVVSVPPYEMVYRLPTSADLRRISGWQEPVLARGQLLEACVLKAQRDGQNVSVGDLPDSVLDSLAAVMSRAEPLADLAVAALCPACGHRWKELFDIVSFFWGEIQARAIRLMREVHILASAYGWREADVLELSAWRRQRYLELVAG